VDKRGTDLVFDDVTPEGFGELANNAQVSFILLVVINTRPIGQ
jgi:hypothetical protein